MLGSAGAESLYIIIVVVHSSECKLLVSLRDAYTTRRHRNLSHSN